MIPQTPNANQMKQSQALFSMPEHDLTNASSHRSNTKVFNIDNIKIEKIRFNGEDDKAIDKLLLSPKCKNDGSD
jgi:hypothetical protein